MRPGQERGTQYRGFEDHSGSNSSMGYREYDPTPRQNPSAGQTRNASPQGVAPYPMNPQFGIGGPPLFGGGGYYFAPQVAMYPPQMWGYMQQQPVTQIKSKVPTVGLVMGILAISLSIIPLIFSTYAFLVPYWHWSADAELLCLGVLFLDAGVVTLSTLGIVFSSISLYRISTSRYQKTPKAATGLVLSIIGGAFFIISFMVLFVVSW